MFDKRLNSYTHTHTRLCRALIVMGAGLTIPTAALADPPQYRIIDLHDPTVAPQSIAYGISDIGEIVGELREGVLVPSNVGAFVWLIRDNYGLDGKTMINLEDAVVGGQSPPAIARDINIHGKIIGNQGNANTEEDIIFLVDLVPQNPHINLSSQSHLGMPGTGRALNNLEPPTIVGWGFPPFANERVGFRYVLNGSVELLEPLPFIPDSPTNQFGTARPHAVSDSDRAAGDSSDTDALCTFPPGPCAGECPGGTWWDGGASAGMVLDGIATQSAGWVGADINSVDDIVGWASDPNITQCNIRATIWPAGSYNNPQSLPVAAGTNPEQEISQANAVSDPVQGERHIVGRSEFLDAAMLWRGNPGNWTAYDLNGISCSETTDFLHLREGADVNTLGWIVGWGDANPGAAIEPKATLLIPLDWCPGDINAGAPDGVVNILDLLAMLGSWGSCPQNTCCLADLDGNGDVDVEDLLFLLSKWGTCPGFGHLQTPPPLEAEIIARGLSMEKWDNFVDVMESGTGGDKANYLCWMQNYLTQCQFCPTCPGRDPFAN